MRVLLLSAYHALSHKYWCEGLMDAFPDYHWQCLSLPPRHFNWRMRGAALSWLSEQSEVITQPYDLLIVTSMVDLATLKGLCPNLAATPSLCYFHENQFEYPKSLQQYASVDSQMVNLYSALAADRVLFNSAFNRDSFFSGVNRLLSKLPDHRPAKIEPLLKGRCQVLPVPLIGESKEQPFTNLRSEEGFMMSWRSETDASEIRIIWASRWEYDKGPERLLAVMGALEKRGVNYRICIAGERFRKVPPEFELIQQQFAPRIVQFGFIDSKLEYQHWLASADIILSTSIHEFQGVAVLEAIAAGCVPVLPKRLAYPELVPVEFLYESHIEDVTQEAEAAVNLIKQIQCKKPAPPEVKYFYWPALKPLYEALLQELAATGAERL